MALIRNDPSQTKTVAALLVVLAAAIVFVIVRVGSHREARPTDATEPTANQAASSASADSTTYSASRNPFKRPAILKAALGGVTESLAGENAFPTASRTGLGARFRHGDPAPLHPMDFGSLLTAAAQPPFPKEVQVIEKPRPEFALLATVKSAGGWCAVIRSGDSRPRVVEVGDVVEGGFKVRRLETDRAVLTDGRDIVIAKRPRT